MKKGLPSWSYKVAIVVATIIWGYSFVSMKDVVAVIPPAWLLGFRFLFAGIVLTAILWKRVRKAFSGKMVLAGTALGLADYLAFWTQTVGLEHTTPGINAFLTATYCVIVPFLWWIIAHRAPDGVQYRGCRACLGGHLAGVGPVGRYDHGFRRGYDAGVRGHVRCAYGAGFEVLPFSRRAGAYGGAVCCRGLHGSAVGSGVRNPSRDSPLSRPALSVSCCSCPSSLPLWRSESRMYRWRIYLRPRHRCS